MDKKKKVDINWMGILGVFLFLVGIALIGLSIYLEVTEVRAQIAQFGFYKVDISISAARHYGVPICGVGGFLIGILGIYVFLEY